MQHSIPHEISVLCTEVDIQLLKEIFSSNPTFFTESYLFRSYSELKPIYLATLLNRVDLIEKFHRLNGPSIFSSPIQDFPNFEYFEPVHLCLFHHSPATLDYLTKHLQIDLNRPISKGRFYGYTLAHLAAQFNKIDILIFLHQYQIKLNIHLPLGTQFEDYTPCDFAIHNQFKNITNFLIAHDYQFSTVFHSVENLAFLRDILQTFEKFKKNILAAIKSENIEIIQENYNDNPWLFDTIIEDEKLHGCYPIHIAVAYHRINVLIEFHRLGLDFNKKTAPHYDLAYFEPIHFCFSHITTKVLDYLSKDLNISLNTPISEGFFKSIKLVHIAIIQENLTLLNYLHQQQIDLNQSITEGKYQNFTSLDLAIKLKKSQALEFLKGQGYLSTPAKHLMEQSILFPIFRDQNQIEKNLYHMILEQDTKTLSVIYHLKSEIFDKTTLFNNLPGFKAIHFAVYHSKLEVLKLFHYLGMDFHQPITENSLSQYFNPLHLCSRHVNVETLNFFNQLKIPLDTPILQGPYQGMTLLHLTAMYGSFEILHYLTRKGIKLNMSWSPNDQITKTPFVLALETNNENAINFFILFRLHQIQNSDLSQYQELILKHCHKVLWEQLGFFAGIEIENMNYLKAAFINTRWYFYAPILSGQYEGFFPVHYATILKSLNILKLLHQLNFNFQLAVLCNDQFPFFEPLHLCFQHQDTKILEFFHHIEIPIDSPIKDGPYKNMTLAELAAKHGNQVILDYIHPPHKNITLQEPLKDSVLTSENKPFEPIQIENKEDMQNFCQSRGLEYLSQTNESYIQHEKYIYLSKCSKLSQNPHEQYYGIYTNTDIPKGVILGEYLGQKISSKQAEKLSSEGHNTSYFFYITKYTCIDGLRHRSWTAFINSCGCYEQENIEVQYKTDKLGAHLIFVTKKPIKAHEQLLYYYGDNYIFEPHSLRFLHPSDSFLDSKDIYQKHQKDYDAPSQIDSALCQHLNIPIHHLFFKPKEDSEHPNLPCLQLNEESELLSQHSQENLSLLMLACWMVDQVKIESLLRKQALLNMQASISGKTAIDFLILSPHQNESIKLAILKSILNPEKACILVITSQSSYSAMYFAIQQHYLKIVQFFMEAFNHYCRFYELQDEEERSIIDYAEAIESHECLEYLQHTRHYRKRKKM